MRAPITSPRRPGERHSEIPHAPGFWVGWKRHCGRHVRPLCMVSDLTQLRERAR